MSMGSVEMVEEIVPYFILRLSAYLSCSQN